MRCRSPQQYPLNYGQRAILGAFGVDLRGRDDCTFQELGEPRDQRKKDAALKIIERLFQTQRGQDIP